ncbi:MAG: 2-oxo acid dehydrogenase subunit E2 [Bacteriovoracaceae bacterium]|nr:2-oxo acid dehydrogenase subunit E2 [Bacteriovoracaceae bacterium]
MARIEVVMPQMGESITTGTITKWHKQPGDVIELDAILLEISTDKVESEIPSPIKGKVMELLFPEGTTVDVGRPIAIIEDDLSAAVTGGGSAPKAAAPTASVPAAAAKTAPAPLAAAPVVSEPQGRRFYTPLVKAMAQEAGIPLAELAALNGSGAGGRVNKEDLESYIASRKSGGTPAAAPAKAAPQGSSLPAGGMTVGRTEVIPMDNMRKAIAKNMVMSKQVSPHVNSVDEIDMTNLVKFREKFKNEFKKREGFNLTYSHFILYAIVQALKENPMVNGSVDGDNIIVKKDIHLGCAVSVPGNGLVVPVIKHAGDLNLTGIARQLDTLANKARTKKLTMDDLSGGTYTFTNNGSFGVLFATPVILQPQVGIFATGVIKKRVMVMEDDSMAIRSMMYGTHTYDHRIIDGELGSKFLASVKFHLENMNPETLF